MMTEPEMTTGTVIPQQRSGEVVTYGDLAVGDVFRIPGGVSWFRVLEVEVGTYPIMRNLRVRFWAESGDAGLGNWISKLAKDGVYLMEREVRRDEVRSSSFKLWDKRLDGDTLTRGQIRQFCHAVAAGGLGYEIGGAHTNLTPEETKILLSKFTRRLGELPGGGYKLTSEHSQFGLSWLRDNPRLARGAGIGEELLAEILATFSHFLFVGTVISHEGGGRVNILPVWRIFYGEGGEEIDYWASPWQQQAYR